MRGPTHVFFSVDGWILSDRLSSIATARARDSSTPPPPSDAPSVPSIPLVNFDLNLRPLGRGGRYGSTDHVDPPT